MNAHVAARAGLSRMVPRLMQFGQLVKFSHTVFALPFAGVMLCVVWGARGVALWQVGWILVALVTARTAAMAYNRWLDRRFDALNPRTRAREIPAGVVSPAAALRLCLIASALFLAAAAALGRHCLILAPLVLLLLLGYSWMKRVTPLSHIVLGLALAAAPGGVWYALTAEWALLPVWLMLAVLFWVAGFDILYSCQDAEFDRTQGLCSVPARLGVRAAFRCARWSHITAVLLLAWFGTQANFGLLGLVGVLVFAGVLASQYRLISPQDLTRIDAAFFERNGLASVLLLCFVVLDTVL